MSAVTSVVHGAGEPGSVPKRFLDVASTDKRPIVVWDLNGTLTCHTAAKNSSGQTIIRDGIRHLRRLEVSSLSL